MQIDEAANELYVADGYLNRRVLVLDSRTEAALGAYGHRPNDEKQPPYDPKGPLSQRPVTAAYSKTRRRTPQGDAELMAKEQVLGFKPALRLEKIDDERSDRVQDCEHRLQSCDDSTSPCESRPDRIFGRDRYQLCRFAGIRIGNYVYSSLVATAWGIGNALAACSGKETLNNEGVKRRRHHNGDVVDSSK